MHVANQASEFTRTASLWAKRLWAGRIISSLALLFLVFDAIGKLLRVAPVRKAFVELGFPVKFAVALGSLLLACAIVYAIPRTSILGAILLTGYLGGAVATQLRAGNPLFETIFPIIFGVLIWAGIFLRDDRLRALVPFLS
ncbi:MAG: hypothetical protein JWO91_3272 [Acidobacteriaceae bacterium]|nr:hypothetical protein [Acidobacteriaceae bacterium]